MYRASGVDRDSYIVGRRSAPKHVHNVNARRDNLPDNVFRYLQEQVAREEYEAYAEENQRSVNAAKSATGHGGRRILHDTTLAAEDRRLQDVEQGAVRAQQLRQLYAKEQLQYEGELRAKGLAIDRA